MKRIVFGVLIISVLGVLTYVGVEVNNFATGMQKDTINLERIKLENDIRNADIIFQTSKSNQSKAIQLATKSQYSHVGIIYKKGLNFYIYEAVQPVKLTPLNEWINRGENKHYVVKRLINADRVLTSDKLKKIREIENMFINTEYDIYFDWSDKKMYCSELVWKVYKRALNLEIGKLEKLKDFDLSSPQVKKILKERYGNNIPLNEIVISPVSIFNSEKLETIISK